jgi:succinate dehydrogenase / fumarate reductase flavoprotein subunit
MSTLVESKLNARVPDGPVADKWTKCKNEIKLVAPNNRRKYTVIVVGSGLAGASAAASLAEMGFNVIVTTIHDTPRRAHSIAAQGGINAAKNYHNDGDSVWRLFTDTVKGGDFRSREANVYRLAEISTSIIDQCVAQGVPFAREYGGTLANRTFGGALVSRTFYCRGQTGQQLLLGAYSALMRQAASGKAKIYPRREMLDLVIADGHARGIVCRNLVTGAFETYAGHAVLLCTGGYGNVFYLSTNAKGCNVTASWRCHKRGAHFANPCYTQIHPTCIPVHGDYQSKLTLMSESLRNDGRVWVPKNKGDKRPPHEIPDDDRDYYLERRYPTYGNMVPRDVASRAAKERCDAGYGVGDTAMAVYLDFTRAIEEQGLEAIKGKYGNLFDMYEKIVGVDAYRTPMMIYPAVHYTMGGLWVDYHLESTVPGLFVLGEANFSDHGANRLGASALMQGLADGYFVAPYTVSNYLAASGLKTVTDAHPKFKETTIDARSRIEKILAVGGSTTVTELHRKLGQIMWNKCGMARNAQGLEQAIDEIRALRDEFWHTVRVPGSGEEFNQNLEYAGRLADFLEFGELLVKDALHRDESCGGHFREEYQTEEGEALRDDDNFCYSAAWEYSGEDAEPVLHKEQLEFTAVPLTRRSYK